MSFETYSDTPTGLGAALRFLRRRKHWTLRQLGKSAAVDWSYLHRLETGYKRAPSPDFLRRVLMGLRIPPTENEAHILLWLGDHPDSDPYAVCAVLERGATLADLVAAVVSVPPGSLAA